jgi:protein CrcB
VGSLLRWLTGRMLGEHFHRDFPLGTFLINVSGAFAIGYLSVLFKVGWRDRHGTALNALVLTGVLGGYTTFSSMRPETTDTSGRASARYRRCGGGFRTPIDCQIFNFQPCQPCRAISSTCYREVDTRIAELGYTWRSRCVPVFPEHIVGLHMRNQKQAVGVRS